MRPQPLPSDKSNPAPVTQPARPSAKQVTSSAHLHAHHTENTLQRQLRHGLVIHAGDSELLAYAGTPGQRTGEHEHDGLVDDALAVVDRFSREFVGEIGIDYVRQTTPHLFLFSVLAVD